MSSCAASDDDGWVMSDLKASLIIPLVTPWFLDLIFGLVASPLSSELDADASLG